MQATGLFRYPVKSCRGAATASAVVEPWGIAGDRRWMLVDDNDECVTAREYPRLLLVDPHPTDGGLQVRAPERPALSVPVPDTNSSSTSVRVWKSEVDAAATTSDAAAWFSEWIGVSVRLVYLADPTQRPTNPAFSRIEDRVSFADGYPLLLTTEESLAELNTLISQGPRAHEGPLPMRRFRPSVVVAGAAAWVEDTWRELRIGEVTFRVVKGCDRCVMTTIDPDTAVGGKEPIATLARHRRWDGKTWFGVNLIPDAPGTINVGDPVQVVRAETSDGPPR